MERGADYAVMVDSDLLSFSYVAPALRESYSEANVYAVQSQWHQSREFLDGFLPEANWHCSGTLRTTVERFGFFGENFYPASFSVLEHEARLGPPWHWQNWTTDSNNWRAPLLNYTAWRHIKADVGPNRGASVLLRHALHACKWGNCTATREDLPPRPLCSSPSFLFAFFGTQGRHYLHV